ncbi:hypothetical protein [Guptibacillus algicola]|uniref:hypothetical protein n=1 Tax=Guptibacillus algicola TaxID=225844 RepID=UPI001CD4E8ED|nr:hypothetical protein [Alkalihalobacillus algicola]MCA0986219.1 hypothetical protein [Alkalihalobacillus algicola]
MDNRTRNLLTVVGLLLLVFGVTMYYFYGVAPKKQEVLRLEKQVEQNEKLIALLQAKEDEKVDAFDTTVLQRKVPVKPLVDQFILDLNRAELVSKSNIHKLDFSDDALNTDQFSNENEDENESSEGETTEETSTKDANLPSEPVVALPEGIQTVDVSMEMSSDNYPSLRKFLLSIEDLPRMALISGLTFSGKSESLDTEEGDPEVAYVANVATFYIPTLTDLAEQTPSIDYPEPSDKDNPLYETVDDEEEDFSEEAASE